MPGMAEYIEKEAFVSHYRTLYCEDCEKRRATTKNGKKRFAYDIGSAPCRACEIDDMLDAVEDFPAADVRENVRGEWVATDGYMVDECSNCHFQICWDDVPSWLERLPHFTNQCPNCGADMRGGAQ